MMQLKFNFNNFIFYGVLLAVTCQRHTANNLNSKPILTCLTGWLCRCCLCEDNDQLSEVGRATRRCMVISGHCRQVLDLDNNQQLVGSRDFRATPAPPSGSQWRVIIRLERDGWVCPCLSESAADWPRATLTACVPGNNIPPRLRIHYIVITVLHHIVSDLVLKVVAARDGRCRGRQSCEACEREIFLPCAAFRKIELMCTTIQSVVY